MLKRIIIIVLTGIAAVFLAVVQLTSFRKRHANLEFAPEPIFITSNGRCAEVSPYISWTNTIVEDYDNAFPNVIQKARLGAILEMIVTKHQDAIIEFAYANKYQSFFNNVKIQEINADLRRHIRLDPEIDPHLRRVFTVVMPPKGIIALDHVA